MSEDTESLVAVAEAPSSSEGSTSSASEYFGHTSTSVDLGAPAPKSEEKSPESPDKVELSEGQGKDSGATPAKDKASDKAQPAPETPAAAGVDERHAEMLRNKGFDPAALAKDPAVLNKFLDNYSNLEREFTKSRQAEKSAQVLKEAQASLPATPLAAPAPKLLSPMEEYEQAFAYSTQPYLASNGVQDIQGLWETNPNLAAYLSAEYAKGSVKALRDDIAWQSKQASEKMQAESQQMQYHKDLSDAETFANNNLAEAKRNYPELDKLLQTSGAESFLKHLEDHYTIPRTFILSDKKWVDFFVKSATAQDALSRMPDHDKEIIDAHMKALDKKQSAQLPSGDGGGEAIDAPKDAEKSTWRNSGGRGVRF